MKKLMIVAAALAALNLPADVVSANTVGYANVGVREGSKMIGASFTNIGSEGMDLFDLKPIGYENVEYFHNEGVVGEFEIKVINKFGAIATDLDGVEMDFFFYRGYAGGDWTDDGIWVQNNEIPVEEKGMVVFDVGAGLLFDVQAAAYEGGVPANQYSLSNAGEALMDSATVTLRLGSKGVIAPLSAAVDLFDIKPIGYEEIPYFFAQGVVGEFEIKVLNKFGGIQIDPNTDLEMDFYYYRTYSDGWQDDGIWVESNEMPVEEKGMVVFQLGEGMLVDVQDAAFEGGVADDQYKLEFPGIDDL